MSPNLVYKDISEEHNKILRENFVSVFRKGYVTVNDCVLPEYYLDFGGRIKNLEVRNSDVWICSFPKCGN